MPIEVANVNPTTDTFGQLVEKVNVVLTNLRTKIVTTDSNTAPGSASITGVFSANSIVSLNFGSPNSSPVFLTSNVTASSSNVNISISAMPTANNHLANKLYVDQTLGNFTAEASIVYSIALG